MLERNEQGSVVLTKHQKEMLREVATHEGWSIYQELLRDLGDEINSSLKKKQPYEDYLRDQSKLEILENVVIPLVRDYLTEEEEMK